MTATYDQATVAYSDLGFNYDGAVVVPGTNLPTCTDLEPLAFAFQAQPFCGFIEYTVLTPAIECAFQAQPYTANACVAPTPPVPPVTTTSGVQRGLIESEGDLGGFLVPPQYVTEYASPTRGSGPTAEYVNAMRRMERERERRRRRRRRDEETVLLM